MGVGPVRNAAGGSVVASSLLLLLSSLLLWMGPSQAVRRLDDVALNVASDVAWADGGPAAAAAAATSGNGTAARNDDDDDGLLRSRRLLGKPVDVPVPKSADDHLVTDLPLLDDADLGGTRHWAGLLPASGDKDKYLFYWLFAPAGGEDSQTTDADIPLLVWLNGGPACSSMDGLWLENGPLRLKKGASSGDWKVEVDPHSWHNAPAYVVYIDQPVGTGIAFTTSGKYPNNDEKVNVDFYYFLNEFFKLHQDKFLTPGDADSGSGKQRSLNRPFYFAGESHAGHYIPSMMNYIRKQNDKPDTQIVMPLSGAAIGNGWVDPTYQYSAQDAAYGSGIIGMAQQRSLAHDEDLCREKLRDGSYTNDVCFGLLDAVVANSQGEGSKYQVSQYDQRKWEVKGKPRDFPPGHRDVEAYLGGHHSGIPKADYRDVLKAVHSTPSLEAGQRYYECTDPPYNALKHQDGLGVVPDVVDLLNAGTRLLFFNGIHDLICNHVGNENAVENFPWLSKEAFQKSERYGWTSPSTGQLGGYMREYENLMYLKVLDSGHMVPLDVPDVSLDMIRTFMHGGSFRSYHQNIKAVVDGGQGGACPACPPCGGGSSGGSNGNGGCAVCDKDCSKVCKHIKDGTAVDAVTDDYVQGPSPGAGWGVAAAASLVGGSLVLWYFLRRRGSGGGSGGGSSGSSGGRTRNGRSRVASRSPSRRNEYDLELSKTSVVTATTNGDNGGGFRDDDGYSDDVVVAANGRTVD